MLYFGDVEKQITFKKIFVILDNDGSHNTKAINDFVKKHIDRL